MKDCGKVFVYCTVMCVQLYWTMVQSCTHSASVYCFIGKFGKVERQSPACAAYQAIGRLSCTHGPYGLYAYGTYGLYIAIFSTWPYMHCYLFGV